MTMTVNQIQGTDGKAAAKATSSPDWFIQDGRDVQVESLGKSDAKAAHIDWAAPFAEVTLGNDVEFFVSGDAYFLHVAEAIAKARKTVFITGWQVNYDVLLPTESGQLTPLLTLLDAAVQRGVNVYLMPWLSPGIGVNTQDLVTLVATAHLNGASAAFPDGPPGRCHCLSSMQQSDMETLSVFFSHHQKLVVIDNEQAYVGGIDLAYGRRDDGNFSLQANGRRLNEHYNACVPSIKQYTYVELQDCVSMAELLAAILYSPTYRDIVPLLHAPSTGVKARAYDLLDRVGLAMDAANENLEQWWDNFTLFDDLVDPIQNYAADTAQGAVTGMSAWAWSKLDESTRQKIAKLLETGGANAESASAALMALINNGSLNKLPPHYFAPVQDIIISLVRILVVAFNTHDKPLVRYEELFKRIHMVPADAAGPDPDVQPRMPWHDVHCCIKGPAVFDLAENFIKRWDATANEYNRSHAETVKSINGLVDQLFTHSWLDLNAPANIKPISKAAYPVRSAPQGSNRVQVLRSAPLKMLAQEHAANPRRKQPPIRPENNCLKAMLRAVKSATKFIYIEGQFFQSAYGEDGPSRGDLSGPTGVLLDIRRSPGYKKFAKMLNIHEVPLAEVPKRMRWAMVDNVRRDPVGDEFLNDVDRALKNNATIHGLKLAKAPQEKLYNPIGRALADRIARAVADKTPFHVYLVLPVHPEGLLDQLNVMTQTHLTLQSLVHGERSLVNEVRRAILRVRMIEEEGMSPHEARAHVSGLDLTEIIKIVRDDWQDYLTLLNLRNWDVINGRPVTEQVYVHSKLLIADDQVAILGSANINDRSQWGDRDSELAVIVHDAERVGAPLAGKEDLPVSASVHQLRKRLWKKLFGGDSADRQAKGLLSEAILAQPAKPATWRAIQKVANRNNQLYETAFWYIPRSVAIPGIQPKQPPPRDEIVVGDPDEDPPAALWPVWRYTDYYRHRFGGELAYRMPFDPLFWRSATAFDRGHAWQPLTTTPGMAAEQAPKGIKGFICALPTRWCQYENNNSGFNLTTLAGVHDDTKPVSKALYTELSPEPVAPKKVPA